MPDDKKLGVPVTMENAHEHPEAPGDILWTKGASIASKKPEDLSWEDHDEMQALAQHPNLPDQAAQELFGAFKGRDLKDTQTEETVSKLLAHKGVDAADIDSFLRELPQDQHAELREAASDRPNADPATFEEHVKQILASPGTTEHTIPSYKHLRPEFYHNLLSERPIPEPEEGQMTDQQKAKNRMVRKIDRVVAAGLGRTRHHTAESVSQTIDWAAKGGAKGMDESDVDDVMSGLADRQDLSAENIEKMLSIKEKGSDRWASDYKEKALAHRNVDPKLLAKLSKKKDAVAKLALADQRLPEQAMRSALATEIAEDKPSDRLLALLNNPNLTPDDLHALHSRWPDLDEVIKHPNLPADVLHNYLDQNDTAAAADTVLSRKKLPVDVLAKLAGTHKNQRVVEEALDHPDADMSVVQAAMKRRAKWAQEAGMRHPLVAGEYMDKRLSEGTLSPHSYLFDERNAKARGGQVSDTAIKDISKTAGTGSDAAMAWMNDSVENLKVKEWLSTNKDIPESVRNQHAGDLIKQFVIGAGHPIIREAVGYLAAKGNDAAQQAVLSVPNGLAHVDLSAEGLDGRFLNSAAGSVLAESKPNNNQLQYIANNSNSTPETIDRIIRSPGFLDYSSNYEPWESRTSRAERGPKTLLDKQYGSLPDQEKEAKFRDILNTVPNSHQAVMSSTQAPKNVWKDAFFSAPALEKQDWLQNHNLKTFVDDDTLSDILLSGKGLLDDSALSWSSKHDPVYKALEALDPGNITHRNMFTQFVRGAPSVFGHSVLSSKNIAASLPDGFTEDPVADSVIPEAWAASPMTGAALADKGIEHGVDNADPGTLSRLTSWVKSASSQSGRSESDLWSELMTDSSRNITGTNKVSNLWTAVKLARQSDPEPMSFLQSLGDPDTVKMAVQLGLFSPEATLSLTKDDPEEMAKSITAGPWSSAPERALHAADSAFQSNDPRIVNHMMKWLDTNHLTGRNPGAKREALSDQAYSNASDTLSKMAAVLGKNGGGAVGTLVDKFIKNDSDSGLTKVMKKSLVKNIMQSAVESAPDGATKAKVLGDIYGTLRRYNEDLLPGRFLSDLTKKAIKDKDVASMIALMRMGDEASKPVKAAFASMALDVGTLPDDDLSAMLSAHDQLDHDLASVVIDGAHKRYQFYSADPAQQSKAEPIGVAFAEVAGTAVRRGNMEMLNPLLSMATSGAPKSQMAAVHSLIDAGFGSGLKNSDVSASAHLFASLPDKLVVGLPSNSLRNGGWVDLPFLNDPVALGSATHGWKLQYFAAHADKLNKESSGVISERILQTKDEAAATAFISSAASSSTMDVHHVPNSDLTKLLRSLPVDKQFSLTSAIAGNRNSRAGIGYADRTVAFATTLMDSLDQHVSDPAEKARLLNSEGIARAVAAGLRLTTTSDTASGTSKQESAAQLSRWSNVMTQSIASVDPSSPSAVTAASDAITAAARFWEGTTNSSNRNYSLKEDVSMNLLRSFAAARDLTNKIKDTHGPETSLPGLDGFALTSWAASSELSDSAWDEAARMVPHLALILGTRSDIQASLLNRLGHDALFDEVPQDAIDAATDAWLPKISGDGYVDTARAIVKRALSARPPSGHNRSEDMLRLGTAALGRDPSILDDKLIDGIEKQMDDSDKLKFRRTATETGALQGKKLSEFLGASVDSSPRAGVPSHHDWNSLKAIARSPHITGDMVQYLQEISSADGNSLDDELVENSKLPSKFVDDIALRHIDRESSHEIQNALLTHPNISRSVFTDLYKHTKDHYPVNVRTGEEFNPALCHPRFGGELFRSLPTVDPDIAENGVDKFDETKILNTASYSPSREKLNKVLPMIAAGGTSWADFKKANQDLSNQPEIRQMFMSRPNHSVTPEDVVREMDSHPAQEFHLTYTWWDGAQRHREDQDRQAEGTFPKSNLVMQLNTSADMESQLNQDPKLWEWYQFVQRAANGIEDNEAGGHPVTPHIAAWVRVDTGGGKKGWIIEEFQSDFGSRMKQEINKIKKDARAKQFKIRGVHYTPEEMDKYTDRIADAFSGWHMAGLRAVEELARKQGVKVLYQHGSGVRATLSGYDKEKQLPKWFQHMYDKVPKQEGWSDVDYSDYPVKSDEFLKAVKESGYDTRVWKKTIK